MKNNLGGLMSVAGYSGLMNVVQSPFFALEKVLGGFCLVRFVGLYE